MPPPGSVKFMVFMWYEGFMKGEGEGKGGKGKEREWWKWKKRGLEKGWVEGNGDRAKGRGNEWELKYHVLVSGLYDYE